MLSSVVELKQKKEKDQDEMEKSKKKKKERKHKKDKEGKSKKSKTKKEKDIGDGDNSLAKPKANQPTEKEEYESVHSQVDNEIQVDDTRKSINKLLTKNVKNISEDLEESGSKEGQGQIQKVKARSKTKDKGRHNARKHKDSKKSEKRKKDRKSPCIISSVAVVEPVAISSLKQELVSISSDDDVISIDIHDDDDGKQRSDYSKSKGRRVYMEKGKNDDVKAALAERRQEISCLKKGDDDVVIVEESLNVGSGTAMNSSVVQHVSPVPVDKTKPGISSDEKQIDIKKDAKGIDGIVKPVIDGQQSNDKDSHTKNFQIKLIRDYNKMTPINTEVVEGCEHGTITVAKREEKQVSNDAEEIKLTEGCRDKVSSLDLNPDSIVASVLEVMKKNKERKKEADSASRKNIVIKDLKSTSLSNTSCDEASVIKKARLEEGECSSGVGASSSSDSSDGDENHAAKNKGKWMTTGTDVIGSGEKTIPKIDENRKKKRKKDKKLKKDKKDKHASRRKSRSKSSDTKHGKSSRRSSGKHRSKSRSRSRSGSSPKLKSERKFPSWEERVNHDWTWRDLREKLDKQRERRGGRRHSRSRSRSKDRGIDKQKLLQIAQENMLRSMAYMSQRHDRSFIPQKLREDLDAIKSKGKSVDDLIRYCKKVSTQSLARRSRSRSHSSEDEDKERKIRHPFALREPPSSFYMNIPNATQRPTTSFEQRMIHSGGEVRKQFPVSTGSAHRQKELEWVPVDPKQKESVKEKDKARLTEALAALPAVTAADEAVVSAVMSTVMAGGSAATITSTILPPNASSLGGTSKPQPPQGVTGAADVALALAANTSSGATSNDVKKMSETKAEPGKLKLMKEGQVSAANIASTATTTDTTRTTIDNAVAAAIAAATSNVEVAIAKDTEIPSVMGPTVLPVKEEDKVFKDTPRVEVGKLIEMRLAAMKTLQSNPFDVQALHNMHQAQEQMHVWAQSKQEPGKYTGEQELKALSQREREQGFQPWIKKDMFSRAAPVQGGMGQLLLQKMGWQPGEALGKDKAGPLVPLVPSFKNDRRGLFAADELKKKMPVPLMSMRPGQGPVPRAPVPLDLSDKHPVSALMELCTKRKWSPPRFELVKGEGPSHCMSFIIKVTVNNMEYQPTFASSTKKQARTQAAMACLQSLGLLPKL